MEIAVLCCELQWLTVKLGVRCENRGCVDHRWILEMSNGLWT